MKITPLAQCLNINTERPTIINTAHVDQIDLSHLPEKFRQRYRTLLRSYADVFSKNDLDVGHCKSLPHQVRLKDPNRITSINQYRLPHHLKEVAIDYVQKLLAAGVIRKSNSVFNSPLMLVKKPHADPNKPLAEQYRLVHNYVELNKNIAPCSYPLRHLYELLDDVAGGKVFSVLDLSQGFFQQHLIDPHEATSFSIPGLGQYSYCRSPQGMNSSPAYFQRMLDFVLNGINRVYVYIDDVVVSVPTHEDNLEKLEQIFARFRKHRLKAKPSKCQFGTARITYLGYDICKDKGVSPGMAKTEVIRNWPYPSNIKEIRGFLGLTSFFRRAIKDFSVLSAELNKLIRKTSGYTSGPIPQEARESFDKLKAALVSKPCLAAVNFDKRFYVTCDASATHYGSCLTQVGDDGIERPVGYASKLLSEKEAKQQPGLRERASIIFSLRHWKPYLVGREFTLRTDHKPNLAIAQGKTKVYDSLSDEIMSYLPFKLEYLNGKDMFADVLSRPLGHDVQAITPAKTSIPDLLTTAHDKAGHLSVQKTLQNLQSQFTWPGMSTDVDNWIRSCTACQKAKIARPRTKEELQKLSPPALVLGDRIHIDLVDMPRSAEGHVAICTLVDAATGYTILQAVTTKTSQAVSSTILEKYVPFFGVPRTLVTDKGKENLNSEIALLTKRYNISHVVSSTNHPQSNGMVERRQQIIIAYLRKTTQDVKDQPNWHLKISELQTIINATISSTRKFSPFFLVFMKHPNFPFAEITGASRNYNTDSSLAARFNLSNKLIQECQQFLEESFQAQKKHFDASANPSPISVGDVVYVLTTQRDSFHRKFANNYKGPYQVVELLQNNNLKLSPLDNGKPVSTHRNNCKKASLRFPHLMVNQPIDRANAQTPPYRPIPDYWDNSTTPAVLDDMPIIPEEEEPQEEQPNAAEEQLPPQQPDGQDVHMHAPPPPPAAADTEDDSPNMASGTTPHENISIERDQSNPFLNLAPRRTLRSTTDKTLHPYVYDELPLERRLAQKLTRKKRKNTEDPEQQEDVDRPPSAPDP